MDCSVIDIATIDYSQGKDKSIFLPFTIYENKFKINIRPNVKCKALSL